MTPEPMKPIPDEVLRVFVRGEDIDNGYYIRASELARELLAARAALRGLLRVSEAPIPTLLPDDYHSPFEAARACLPVTTEAK